MITCPHLDVAGACGIYSVRPVTCKIWFSSDLRLCIRNRQQGYPEKVNPLTDASNKLRVAFETPFKERVNEIVPDMDFDGHDFLLALEEVARLDDGALLDTLKAKIDAGEQNNWEPFGS